MTGRSKGRQVLSEGNPASPWDASLKQADPEMAALLNRELERQQDNIELIASENFAPPAVLDAVGASSPTSMRRVIRERATMVVARSLMKWRLWLSRGPKRSTEQNTPTYNPTLALRQTRLRILRLWMPGTAFWP